MTVISAIDSRYPFNGSNDVKIQEIDRKLTMLIRRAKELNIPLNGMGISRLEVGASKSKNPFEFCKKLLWQVKENIRAGEANCNTIKERVYKLVGDRKNRVMELQQVTDTPEKAKAEFEKHKQVTDTPEKAKAEFEKHKEVFGKAVGVVYKSAETEEDKIFIIKRTADLYQDSNNLSIGVKQLLIAEEVSKLNYILS